MDIETARIDGGMSIAEIREEIKICERIKREEINRIYRLKAELENAQQTSKIDRKSLCVEI